MDALREDQSKASREQLVRKAEGTQAHRRVGRSPGSAAARAELEAATLAAKRAAQHEFTERQQQYDENINAARLQSSRLSWPSVNDESLRVLSGLKDLASPDYCV